MGNAKSIATVKNESDEYVIISKDGRHLVKKLVQNIDDMLKQRHPDEYYNIVYGYNDIAKAWLLRVFAEAALNRHPVNVEEIIGFAGDRHTRIYEDIYDVIVDTVSKTV